MIVTAVPSGAQRYVHSATSIGTLTQPWLMGVPKFVCQYVPRRACTSSGTFRDARTNNGPRLRPGRIFGPKTARVNEVLLRA